MNMSKALVGMVMILVRVQKDVQILVRVKKDVKILVRVQKRCPDSSPSAKKMSRFYSQCKKDVQILAAAAGRHSHLRALFATFADILTFCHLHLYSTALPQSSGQH